MKASTIITIMGLLEDRKETLTEMEAEARKAKDTAQKAFYRTEEVIAMDDEKAYNIAKELPEYKAFDSIHEELRRVYSALDDFANHDFH